LNSLTYKQYFKIAVISRQRSGVLMVENVVACLQNFPKQQKNLYNRVLPELAVWDEQTGSVQGGATEPAERRAFFVAVFLGCICNDGLEGGIITLT
jgi:hypothetical protein